MSAKTKLRGQAGQTPAPNAYTPVYQKTVHAVSLASRQKDTAGQNTVPGPGAYSPNCSFGKKSSGAYSMRSRTFVKRTSENPAPGHYNPVPIRPHTSNCMLAGRPHQPEPNQNPGPANYNVREKFGAGARNSSFSFRQDSRPGYNAQQAKTPGPGSYCIERQKRNAKCTYIGLKFDEFDPQPYLPGKQTDASQALENAQNNNLVIL